MSFEVTLTYSDEAGRERTVPVTSQYFTIGRNPENNLSIPLSNLSRQHAMLERFENFVQITDCGSQNGTTVNGVPVMGAVELHPGDIINLGGACSLVVGVRAAVTRSVSSPASQQLASVAQPAASYQNAPTLNAPPDALPLSASSGPAWRPGLPLVAAVAGVIFVLLMAMIVVMMLPSNGGKKGPGPKRTPVEVNENITLIPDSTPLPTQENTTTTISPNEPNIGLNPTPGGQTVAGNVGLDKIESAAVQVIGRITTDSKSYSFQDKALRDIAQKIESYRASSATVASALVSLRRGGPALAASARHEGISQPYLIFYAGLAQSDGGRSGRDPLATAQSMLPDLISLRALFGDDADSSLLVIAAYPEGPGSKKSHPLIARLPRVTDKPSQRNVWYLYERHAISDGAYDLVIRFLALGIIAQNPKQYGVQAEPLAF